MALITLTLGLTWYTNTHFLSREALRASLSGRLPIDRIDAQYAQMKRNLWVSYAVVPVYVGLRVVLAALLLQLIFLARGTEIKIGAVVQACALAYVTVIINTSVDVWTFAHPSSARGIGSIEVFVPPTAFSPILFLAHSVSVYELAWCAILLVMIKRFATFAWPKIATSILACWLIITGLQVAIVAYIARVVG